MSTNGAYDTYGGYATVEELRVAKNVLDAHIESLRADVRNMGDRVASAVYGVHSLTADIDRRLTELNASSNINHATVMRLLKQALAPKPTKRKSRKRRSNG